MANNCFYDMKIVGDTKEAVDEFVGMLTYENQDRYFARIFDADVYERTEINGKYTAKVSGDCAWSVHSCMCDGMFTYYDKGRDDKLTCLSVETERLGLTVEIYSEEPGVGFAEHYIYQNGDCLLEDEVDLAEYWWDDGSSLEEFLDEYGLNDLNDEQLNQLKEEGYIVIGGYGKIEFSI